MYSERALIAYINNWASTFLTLLLMLISSVIFFLSWANHLNKMTLNNFQTKFLSIDLNSVLNRPPAVSWVSPVPTGGQGWGCHCEASTQPGSPLLAHTPPRCQAHVSDDAACLTKRNNTVNVFRTGKTQTSLRNFFFWLFSWTVLSESPGLPLSATWHRVTS